MVLHFTPLRHRLPQNQMGNHSKNNSGLASTSSCSSDLKTVQIQNVFARILVVRRFLIALGLLAVTFAQMKLALASTVALPAGVPAIQFKKIQIELISKDKKNKRKISVELAVSSEQQQRGLMYRTAMPADEGMLFQFSSERTLAFWMKNTYIPLDIAYLNKDLVIVDIQQMQPASTLLREDPPSYPSAKPAQYALEMNQGWFRKNRFKVGDQVRILK